MDIGIPKKRKYTLKKNPIPNILPLATAPLSSLPVHVPSLPVPSLPVPSLPHQKRCPNGTRRNPKTKLCEKISSPLAIESTIPQDQEQLTQPVESFASPIFTPSLPMFVDKKGKKRCPNKTRKDKNGNCVPIQNITKKVKQSDAILEPVSDQSTVNSVQPNDIDVSDDVNLEDELDQYAYDTNEYLAEKEKIEYKLNADSSTDEYEFLYPDLNDPNFNIKIAKKKEFRDTSYNAIITDIKKQAERMCKAEFELMPHQLFVKNFLSFQTP